MTLDDAQLRERLQEALDYGGNLHTIEELASETRAGRMQCWHNDQACCFTQLEDRADGRGAGERDVFGLRISGESMIEAGIHDGDYVVVKKQPEAQRGAMIIAMVGDEATCKFYFPEAQHVRLQPANAAMAPILVPKNEWRETQILGVVVGMYRKM